MAMGCSWPGWLPLQQRLVRSGAVEGLRYVESLDVTKPGYDLHSLVLALQAEAPLEEPGWTVFDGLPRALRAELLLLLSWLLPRLPREPLRRLLQQFLGRQPHPAHGWDIRIAEELLFQLQANSDGGVGAEANRAGQLRSAVVAVMRSVLYAETVKSLNAMMAKEPGGGSRSWPALASFGPQDVSRRMDRKDQEDDEAPSPKRQRTAHDSEAQRQTISVDKSDGDSAVVSTPAFTLSQEPPQSQQIEWQMPTENPRQRQDDIGETPRGAGDLSDLLLSQAPATTPLAARTQQFVAAPPSLLPMQLQVSTTQSLQTTAAAAPVTTHAPVQDPDVAPIARPGNSAAVDTAYPPAGAEQVDGWAALSVAMKPLRVGIASTAGNDSSEVVDKVVEAIEGARQHLAACVTTLELSTLSDASLLRVATGLLTQEQSFRIATEFIATAILPRISALSATASRPLLAVCQLATLHQPKATQTHLLLPLLCESNMGSAQAELILRSVKGKDGLGLPLVQALLEGSLSKAPPCDTETSLTPSLPWGDPLLHTWHSVLGLRLALPAVTILLPLLKLLEAQASEQQKSQKYCNVLFALVSKYGPQLAAAERESIDILERLLTGCTSFVRKPALTALVKLKKSL